MADGGDSMEVVLAGVALRLYADRALYWPEKRRLLVADLHLGKDDTFRAAGIALPAGSARHDLERLSALIEHSRAEALWFLGDLLHGPLVDTHWREDWAGFRARHAGLEMLLVEGNHDRAATQAGLGIEHRRDRVEEAHSPLVFAHAPQAALEGDGRLLICGHLHPVVRVPGFRGRFPAFAHIDHQLVLPAFSLFTGGWLVRDALSRHACMNGHLLDMGPTR
ncbi:ligase-associated DNA damage response endonuclease PdeM [Hydrogenophaga sp.]|jgi:DNA ligase-associated metallophosphoesterase|uniref:ligase-associated DNA damage response endonuclease PdeM n=1 Tax=Hydrogenophaga sp. TaxID=1904254 RepID=UPI003F72A9D3